MLYGKEEVTNRGVPFSLVLLRDADTIQRFPETPAVPQRNERYAQGGAAAGRPEVESPKQHQQPLGSQVGPPAGFGRGGPATGLFDGPNSKRRRY